MIGTVFEYIVFLLMALMLFSRSLWEFHENLSLHALMTTPRWFELHPDHGQTRIVVMDENKDQGNGK